MIYTIQNRFFLALLFLSIFVFGYSKNVIAEANWYNLSWPYRQAITINHNSVSSNLTDFPVVISLTDTDLEKARTDGYDFLITNSDGVTKLSHEIEKWDDNTGALVVWVKVPTLSSSTDTTLYLYYGNASASNQQDVTNTWDNNYRGVFHFANTSGLTLTDSTVSANNLTNSGAAATSGQLTGAALFDGTDKIYRTSPTGLPGGTGAFTEEFWYRTDTNKDNQSIGGWGDNNGSGRRVNALITGSATGLMIEMSSTVGTWMSVNPIGTWHHVVITNTAGNSTASSLKLYHDGVLQPSSGSGTFSLVTSNLVFGKLPGYDGNEFGYVGALDEIRVSNTTRSADWIATEFANQYSPGGFSTSAGEEVLGIAAATGNATNMSGAAATLNGTLNDLAGNGSVFVWFEYGATTAYGTSTTPATISSTGAQSTTITDLTIGATYHYRLCTSETNGNNEHCWSDSSFVAPDWYNSSWYYRKQIVIDHTKVGNDLTNFPVLISRTDTDLEKALANGYDFVFTSADGTTKLNHEIEAWDDSSGALVAWVKVPTLSSSTDTILYLYYGNASASNQEAVTTTWSGYAAVYHLGETSTTTDSTSNARTASTTSNITTTTGKINTADSFNGSSSYVRLGTWHDFTSFSVSMWVNTGNSQQDYANMIDNNHTAQGWALEQDGSTLNYYGGINIPTGSWSYLVITYDNAGTYRNIYLNGRQVTGYSGTTALNGSDLRLGNWANGGRYWKGYQEEVRFTPNGTTLSPAWISTEYNNQNSPSTFYSLSSEMGYNAAPSTPSSLGPASYVNGSTVNNYLPTLSFTLADSDGSDTVKYKIQIDDSADFGSLIVDYTSALAAQGATSFTVGQAAGSGTYTTGSASTVLVAGTSYYWRVKTIDNSASASSYATANSGAVAFVVGQPTVTLGVSGSPLAENGGTATVTATLSASASQDTTVNLSYSGTATNTTDYTRSAASCTVTGNIGSTSCTITLTGVNDALDEAAETVIVDISTVTNGSESGTQQVTGSITDDDAAPTVTLSQGTSPFAENGGTDVVTATLSAVSGQDVTVDLSYSGTATNVSDYTRSGTQIIISAGGTTGTVTLTGVNDTLDEAAETVIVDISGVTNGTESGTQQVTVSITDDDAAPTVTLSQGTSPFAENGGTDVVTASLSAVSGQDVTVDLSYSGTATNSSDYTRSGTQIIISAGSTTGTVTLTGVNDALDETDETVIVDISGVTNGTESGTQQVTGTLTDDDATPTVTIGIAGSPITENAGVATVTATLSAVSGQDVTVNLAFTGTATDATDYTKSATSISIVAGSTTGTMTLTGITDLLDETDETIITDISSVTNGTESGTQQVTATITDDDSAGVTLTQSGGSTDITEDGTTDTYTVVLNSQPTADVTITVTGSADASVNLSSLTFTSGNWNIAQTITVTAVNDELAEGNHTGIITHTSASADTNYNALSIGSVTANIVDNDSAGVSITQSGGTTSVSEGGSTDTYTLVLTSEPLGDVDITVTPADETNGVTVDTETLTFTSVNWDTPQTITVTASNDLIAEGSQAILVTHVSDSSDPNYQDISIATVSVAITDNDAQGITLAESDGTTALADSEAEDNYTFVLTSQPTANVVITVSAEAGINVSPSSVTFTSDNWNIAQTITVSADDSEFDETATNKTITHSVASADANYQGLTLPSVLVTLAAAEAEDNVLTANAGGDRTMTSGTSITLNGTASTGDILSYSWVLVSGCGSLSDETSVTPIYTAPASDCEGEVEVGLTVTDALSQTATDSTIIHVIEKAKTSIETVEGAAVMSQSHGYTIYENHEDDVTTLTVGNAQVELPDVSVMGDYTVAVSSEGYFVICFPAFQGGRCYVSKVPVGQLSGNIELGDADVTVQGLVKSQGTQYTPLTPKTASTSADFNTVTSSQSGDQLGSYIATGDINGDGEDEILIASPGAGNYGILYIYDLNATIIGFVLGSETYPIQSVLVSNYITSQNRDVIFGPNNPALNQSLRKQGALEASAKNNFGFLLNGANNLETSTDLSIVAVDGILGRGASYQSIALGDLNNDAQDDLIMGSDEGYVYIYFGPVDPAIDLTTDAADVIIAGFSTENFGQMIATGDVSGDGIDDLMIGAPNYGASLEGAVYVVYGTTNWDSAIDVVTSAQVMLLGGDTANGQIGSDLIIADLESTGTNDIYTIDTNDTVIKLSLSGGDASTGGTDSGPESLGGNLSGAGCQLNASASSSTKLLLGFPFIFIVSTIVIVLAGISPKNQKP